MRSLTIPDYFCKTILRQLNFIACLFLGLSSFAQILPNFGGQRAGLSALSFLKNDMSPQSFGMGGASVASPGNLYSAEVNPAALVQVGGSGFVLSNMVIGAGINQSLFSGTKMLDDGSVIGFGVNSLNSGAMEVRTEFEPNGTGQQFYVNNTALGLSYGRRLSQQFSLGIGVKFVYEGIAAYQNHTVTSDIGFLYTTDFRGLTFAVSVKNFGGNSSLSGDDLAVGYNRTVVSVEKYTAPTIFKMGLSFVPYETETKKLLVSAELNHPSDNAENIRIGSELSLRKLLYLRLGYKLSVKGQNLPTAGLGIKTRIGSHPLYVDYGINPTNRMGVQHIFGIHIPFNNDKR